jgi:hypothetical protein
VNVISSRANGSLRPVADTRSLDEPKWLASNIYRRRRCSGRVRRHQLRQKPNRAPGRCAPGLASHPRVSRETDGRCRDAARRPAWHRCSDHRVSWRLARLLALLPPAWIHGRDVRTRPRWYRWASRQRRPGALNRPAPAPSGMRPSQPGPDSEDLERPERLLREHSQQAVPARRSSRTALIGTASLSQRSSLDSCERIPDVQRLAVHTGQPSAAQASLTVPPGQSPIRPEEERPRQGGR